MISASQLSRSSVWSSSPFSPRGPTDGCQSCRRSITPSREMYVELMIFRIGSSSFRIGCEISPGRYVGVRDADAQPNRQFHRAILDIGGAWVLNESDISP